MIINCKQIDMWYTTGNYFGSTRAGGWRNGFGYSVYHDARVHHDAMCVSIIIDLSGISKYINAYVPNADDYLYWYDPINHLMDLIWPEQ